MSVAALLQSLPGSPLLSCRPNCPAMLRSASAPPAGSGEYRSCRSSCENPPRSPDRSGGHAFAMTRPNRFCQRPSTANTGAKHDEPHTTGTDDPPVRISMKHKVVTASEAIALTRDGDTLVDTCFVGCGAPEDLLATLEQRFLESRWRRCRSTSAS